MQARSPYYPASSVTPPPCPPTAAEAAHERRVVNLVENQFTSRRESAHLVENQLADVVADGGERGRERVPRQHQHHPGRRLPRGDGAVPLPGRRAEGGVDCEGGATQNAK